MENCLRVGTHFSKPGTFKKCARGCIASVGSRPDDVEGESLRFPAPGLTPLLLSRYEVKRSSKAFQNSEAMNCSQLKNDGEAISALESAVAIYVRWENPRRRVTHFPRRCTRVSNKKNISSV